jgi:cell division septation protein DedD
MPKNEDGEFELILGNRTLLLVFFVVVALLGVFFTMGYIVGRNSTPVIASDSGSGRKNDSKPLVVDSTPKAADSAPVAAPKETAVQQPSEPAKEPEADKPVETAKAEPEKAKPEPAKETAKETAKERKAEAKAKKEAAAKMEKAKPALSSGGSPSGTYLQLAATSQREAEIMVDVLRKKEFKAMTAEIPEKPGLFRVLVGPVTDASVNKTRTDLKAAGFPADNAIKRSF